MDTGAKHGGNVLMSDSPVRFDQKTVPPEINRWNWGAFLLNWIWGIGNQTYIALLALIPGFGFIWMLVLGAKGSAWAWRNGRWDSVEHFKRVQRKWAIWGAIIWIAVPALFGAGIGGIFFGLKHSAAYEMAVAKLQADPVAVNVLGSPISTGTPYGEISVDGSSGKAELSFSATGPKAAGVVFVEAVEKEGVWSITRLAFKLNDSDKVIDLLGGAKGDTT
jgi:Cytochrome oxidase complex assembly protein 1